MRIPRSILIHNLQLISQTSESTGFDANCTGLLTKTDQATSYTAKMNIAQTFTQASYLEESTDRIWIEIGNKAHSLGHLIKDKTHLVPQDVLTQPLKDEVHDLLEVEVMLERKAPYRVYVEESSLRKSEMIKKMLEDGSEGDAMPITDLDLNTDQLDLAFNFIKTRDLPSDLSTTDCVALLTFANFLDHPSFMDKNSYLSDFL